MPALLAALIEMGSAGAFIAGAIVGARVMHMYFTLVRRSID